MGLHGDNNDTNLPASLLLILEVIRFCCVLIKFPIDLPDCVGAIMLPKLIKDHFEIGHWVQVLQGPYKGNIGLVNSIQTWLYMGCQV